MLHKDVWMGYLIRLKLTRKGLLILLANHYTIQGAHIQVI